MILFPWWFNNRYSQQNTIIEDICPYGNGIREVLNILDGYGGWENETEEKYHEEFKRHVAMREAERKEKGE